LLVTHLAHTSAYVSIRQHTSAFCRSSHTWRARKSIRQHTSAYVSIRQHSVARHTPGAPGRGGGRCRIRRGSSRACVRAGVSYACTLHTPYVSIRQHTSAYVSIRQHTSAYVSIRQHTSAYVSIRQHTSAYVSIHQLAFVQVHHMRAHLREQVATKYVSIRHEGNSIRPHTSASSAYARQRLRSCRCIICVHTCESKATSPEKITIALKKP
jgi:hypothetical protein